MRWFDEQYLPYGSSEYCLTAAERGVVAIGDEFLRTACLNCAISKNLNATFEIFATDEDIGEERRDKFTHCDICGAELPFKW